MSPGVFYSFITTYLSNKFDLQSHHSITAGDKATPNLGKTQHLSVTCWDAIEHTCLSAIKRVLGIKLSFVHLTMLLADLQGHGARLNCGTCLQSQWRASVRLMELPYLL